MRLFEEVQADEKSAQLLISLSSDSIENEVSDQRLDTITDVLEWTQRELTSRVSQRIEQIYSTQSNLHHIEIIE